MKYDLTKQEDRIAAIAELNKNCRLFLEEAGVKLYTGTVIEVSDRTVTFTKQDGEGKTLFGCELRFYTNKGLFTGDTDGEPTISMSSVAAFNPSNGEGSTSRIMNAASVLSNWEQASRVLVNACEEYKMLVTEINAVNKL